MGASLILYPGRRKKVIRKRLRRHLAEAYQKDKGGAIGNQMLTVSGDYLVGKRESSGSESRHLLKNVIIKVHEGYTYYFTGPSGAYVVSHRQMTSGDRPAFRVK